MATDTPVVYSLALSHTRAADCDGNSIALQPIAGAVEVREQTGTRPAVSAGGAGDRCQTTPASGTAAPLAALLAVPMLLRGRRQRGRDRRVDSVGNRRATIGAVRTASASSPASRAGEDRGEGRA